MPTQPAQYRKRPVVIDAMRYDGTPDSVLAIEEAFGASIVYKHDARDPKVKQGLPASILTLEGPMTANPGDWIVRGIQGECYPVKPDIFEATYELVEAT